MRLSSTLKHGAAVTALVLGLVAAAPLVAGAAPAQASPAPPGPLDTFVAYGNNQFFFNTNITAQSGPSGESPTGHAYAQMYDGRTFFDGPVTCLNVTGPGMGRGTASSPTTAYMTINSTDGAFDGAVGFVFVDRGGHGQDTIDIVDSGFLSQCSYFQTAPQEFPYPSTAPGGARVFDAPALPTGPTAVTSCTLSGSGPSLRNTVTGLPANQTYRYFAQYTVLTNGGETASDDGAQLVTDSTGAGASGGSGPLSATPVEVIFAVYRDTNGNRRWDPGTDSTVYQGTEYLIACPQTVTQSPK